MPVYRVHDESTMIHLADLLCELFDDASLRRFVIAGEQGEAIAAQLPGAGASVAALANASARQIGQRGLVPVTVKRLNAEFPHRALDIAKISAGSAGKPGRSGPATRIVGQLLIGNALLSLAMLTAELSLDFPIPIPEFLPLALVADALFAITLGTWLMHDDRPRGVTIAALYLLAESVGGAVYSFASDQTALAFVLLAFDIPLLVLLGIRSIGRLGRALVAFPLVLYFAFFGLLLCFFLSGFSPSTAVYFEDGEPVLSHYVTGGRGHRIDLPFGGWVKAKPSSVAQFGEELVLAIGHPPSDSVVSIFDIARPGDAQDIDQCVDFLFGQIIARTERWELISRQPLTSGPDGRLLRYRFTRNGFTFEGWMVVWMEDDRVYQVNAYASALRFAAVEPRLRGTVESFRPTSG